MNVIIVSSDTLEGLLAIIVENLEKGWRLYGTPFVVGKSMCEELPDGVDPKGKRICLMMVRNVKE